MLFEAISVFFSQPFPGGSAASPVPPPSPVHRRSPVPRQAPLDDADDTVAETTDSTVIIRMTPRQHGEEILTVEMGPGEEGDGQGQAEEKKEE